MSNSQRPSRLNVFLHLIAPAILLPGCAAGVVGIAALAAGGGGGGGGGNNTPPLPAVTSVDRNFAATSGSQDGEPGLLTLRVVNIPAEFRVSVKDAGQGQEIEACIPEGGVDRNRGTLTLEIPDHRFFFPTDTPCIIDPVKGIRLPTQARVETARPGVVLITVTDTKSGQQSSTVQFFYNPPRGPAEPTEFEDPQARLIDKGGISVPLEGQYFTFLDPVCKEGYPNPSVEGTKAFIQRVDGATTISREVPIAQIESDDKLTLNVDKASIDVLLATKVQPTTTFNLRIDTPNGLPVQVPVFLGLPYPVEEPSYFAQADGTLILRWVDNCDGPPLAVPDGTPLEQIDPDLAGSAGNDTPVNERFPPDTKVGVENYVNGFRIVRRKGGSNEQVVLEKNFPGKAGPVIQEYATKVPATDGIYSYTIVGQIGGDVRTAPVEVFVPVIFPSSAYDIIWDRTPRSEICNDEADNDADGNADAQDSECNQESEAGQLAAALLRLGRRSLVYNKSSGIADILGLFTESQRSRIVSLWIIHGENTMTMDDLGQQTLDTFKGNLPLFTEEDANALLQDPPDRIWLSAGNLWSRAYDTDPTVRQRSGPTRALLEKIAGRSGPPDDTNLLLGLTATSGPVTIPGLEGDFILGYLPPVNRSCGLIADAPFTTLALRDDLAPILARPEDEFYESVRDICFDGKDNDADGLTDAADAGECPAPATAAILSIAPGLTSLSSAFTALSFGPERVPDVAEEVTCALGLEICNNKQDDNGDGLIDALDPLCVIPVEICTNNADDDFDGKVDCDDPECVGVEGGQNPDTCFNRIDDDCDGFLDLFDSDCTFGEPLSPAAAE
jgi:hypothetical protein